jgi:hypothetical protein
MVPLIFEIFAKMDTFNDTTRLKVNIYKIDGKTVPATSVSDPSGQWIRIRIEEGKNDPQK